jgi:hypothetical protein
MPLVTILALLGMVMVGKALGYWQTSGRDMIDPNAPMTSADIRGWMSLEFLSDGFGIPLPELRALLGVPASTPAGTPLKDLESIIEVSEVRTRIGEALGQLPAAPEAPAEDHAPATPTARPAELTATATPAATVPDHQPGTGQGAGEGTGEGPTPLPPGRVLPAAQIKGRMTLDEVSEQCDVPLGRLIDELGIPSDTSANLVLRDLVAQIEGFEVSKVREVVAALQAE